MPRNIQQLLHEGEISAQQRFDERQRWQSERGQQALDQMFKTYLDTNAINFIKQQHYFFIATADGSGECDCSFRGTEPDLEGNKQPAIIVRDEHTLVFPDYTGNYIYNSLGNMLDNPHIGILFIDFINATRFRVNGSVNIVEDKTAYQQHWATALRYVEVTVKQAYANCSKRIQQSVQL
ncbi:pyridoxamine 5'-phosphate oxidase family protein [Candidatus Albibeggiatoa sp. nov. NOAA]|uniref:pyridoxamine 5'-phosphate oxidase family protein n=1 Tax=Candidatus Albibeggiatoa sp. nov. NOAA TaxID=3162724 RepID=UPI00330281B6|nr:pyridoxamine 5'-phosphate oxidase family protein [Thiotrichaceae bacterium]